MQTSQLKRRKIEAPFTNCLNASSTKDAENKNTVVCVKHCVVITSLYHIITRVLSFKFNRRIDSVMFWH